MTLKGGSLQFLHSNANQVNYSTTVGTVSLGSGDSTISTSVSKGNGSSILTLSGLARAIGATVNFAGTLNDGSAQIAITSGSNNAAGIVGGWATAGGTDWATIDASGNIAAFSSYATFPTSGGSAGTNYSRSSNGLLTLTGSVVANSLNITVSSGTLALGANNLTFSGTSGGLLYSGGGTYTISGSGYIGAGAANEFIVYSSGGTLAINAPIIGGSSATGGLTKSGSGVLVLGTSNAYTGTTYLNNGTLKYGASNALPFGSSTGNLIINGGTLDIAGVTANLNGLSGGGIVTDSGGAATLTVGNNNVTSTYGGVIDGATPISLNKTGSGTFTLTNANSFVGATSVAAGTLKLVMASTNNISTSSQISISGGATLDVSGLTGGALNLNQGLLAPGSGTANITGSLNAGAKTIDMSGGNIGTLAVSNGLTLSGGTLKFDLGASSGAADQLAVGGAATVSGTNVIQLSAGASLPAGGTFNVITAASGLGSGFVLSSPRVLSGTDTYTVTLTQSGSNDSVTVHGVVPIYNLSVSTGNNFFVGGSAAVASTIASQTQSGLTVDNLNYTGLAASITGGTLSGSAGSGQVLAGSSSQNSGLTFSSNTAGTFTLTPTANATDVADGGVAVSGTTATASITVYNHAAGAR